MERRVCERRGWCSDLEISLAVLLEHRIDVELEDVAEVRRYCDNGPPWHLKGDPECETCS